MVDTLDFDSSSCKTVRVQPSPPLPTKEYGLVLNTPNGLGSIETLTLSIKGQEEISLRSFV